MPDEEAALRESILNSSKKVLNTPVGQKVFDSEIIIFVNSVLSTLTQLGVGPDGGFEITGENETWDDFTGGDTRFNMVKSYVPMAVKLQFDPPPTGPSQESIRKIITENEWRLMVIAEEVKLERERNSA